MIHAPCIITLLLTLAIFAPATEAQESDDDPNVTTLDVAPVWAGHRVGFSLLTDPPYQYVAYYDDQRRMTVAQRRLGSETWTYKVLPETVGWDSHNYITMALDSQGRLHVSGNMHGHPLVYFRSARPQDVTTLQRVESMVGSHEDRVTYPHFMNDRDGRLIYYYRDGGSGDGQWIYNVYDAEQDRWSRLLDQPLLARVGRGGEGTLNAYPQGPRLGPDGWFHLVWCWRDTPDAATNHDVSYARSRDLVNWETSSGTPVDLPMTIDTAEIIDPVSAGGGLINSNLVFGFDHQDRPVVSYHKFDEAGNTQIHNARLEDGGWKIHQVTDWDYRWDFGGGGSIVEEVGVAPVQAREDGTLTQGYSHVKYGSGTWVLDSQTLRPTGKFHQPSPIPASLRRVESAFEGMEVNWASDSGQGPAGVSYRLRWETLPQNRDQPRQGPLPEPSMLRVVEIRADS